MKNRSLQFLKNSTVSILLEILSIACGLLVPRLILTSYGSMYNGMLSSITQFTTCLYVLQAGIGKTTKAALYKPLAEENKQEIEEIMSQTHGFFTRISRIFLFFVALFALYFSTVNRKDINFYFTFILVIVVSISSFIDFICYTKYTLLLEADQRGYVYSLGRVVYILTSTIATVVLVRLDYSLIIAKLAVALCYCFSAYIVIRYCKAHYQLAYRKPSKDYLPQRKHAVFHQVSSLVNNNSDILIITLLSSLLNVSIYTTYNYVASSIWFLISSITDGFYPAIGDMLSRDEKNSANNTIKIYEYVSFSLITTLFTTTLITIVPFVMLYTASVNDADYYQPVFSAILVTAYMIRVSGVPYSAVIDVTGSYEKTKKYSIMEAVINIVASVALYYYYDIAGVALGTAIAFLYKAVSHVNFASRNLINKRVSEYFRHFVLAIVATIISCVIASHYIHLIDSWLTWVIYSGITFIMTCVVTLVINTIFFKEETLIFSRALIDMLKKSLLKRSAQRIKR